MKKKKGFTLIELLAVIVILAIIALIATPIVMNVIENARKGAAERSAENYVRAVDTAIMAEKLNGPVSDGVYTVTSTGDLCLGEEATCDKPIEVGVNGDAPKEGSKIAIENNKVVQNISNDSSQKTTVSVGDYTVEYNEEGKLEASKEEIAISKLCRPATATGDDAVTVGNVPVIGQYNYGDEYICDLGDGEERRFFVLEVGTNPVEGSELLSDQVALIMNSNIGENTPWNYSDGLYEYGPTDAMDELETNTSDWKVLAVNLPNGEQIDATYDYINSWLSVNLQQTPTDGSGLPFGYWLYAEGASYEALVVQCNGYENSCFATGRDVTSTDVGVRPVITLSMNDLQ